MIHINKMLGVIEDLQLDINAKVDWLTVDPNKEFKDLKKFVKELFKEYRNEY